MSRPTTSRDVARAVLRRVDQGEAYATLALGGELERSGLGPADRGLATELVYGVLRHRARLDRALAAFAPRGLDSLPAPVRTALRVAAHQLLATRVPAHAAVDDAVTAITATAGPKVAGFANAILRKLSREGEPPPPADLLERLEQVHSFPGWLAQRLIAALSEAEVEAAAEAFNRAPPVVLRAAGIDRDALSARVVAERPQVLASPSPYLPEALLLRNAGAPETLEVFRDGACTVQDTAAQLVTYLVGANDLAGGETILDACSGVGGKATHLADRGKSVRIDAADCSRRKLDLAEDTIRRMRLTNIRTIVADLRRADAPLAASYDRVLLDAPCSGLGVLRRHPEAKWRRDDAGIAALAVLQGELLDALSARVKPGGVLVYSVCTFTVEEGPRQIAQFLAAHPEFERAAPEGPIPAAAFFDAAGNFTTWPHRHDADAFFAARLVRRRG